MITAFLAVCMAGIAETTGDEAISMQLWYDQPAQYWVEAMPIGNGRLGAMVFGGVSRERIQLNEDSLWTGEPQDADNPESSEALPEVRRLQLEGGMVEAELLTKQKMVCKGEGSHRGDGAAPFHSARKICSISTRSCSLADARLFRMRSSRPMNDTWTAP